MHEFSEFNVKIPEFLIKLWKLVDDPDTDDFIRWSDNGKSFVIVKPHEFTIELLPLNFKHGNMASFNRQLNMYGFQKTNHTLESKPIKDSMVFAHPCFLRGHPYLLENIKRKKTMNRSAPPLFSFVRENVASPDKSDVKADILTQVLLDINNLKSKQANWDTKLSNMKRENEALWKELAIFRQKHVKQEQIINKLIHFIVTMVRPSSRNVSIRRRYPLMINDAERGAASSSSASIRELDPLEAFLTDTGSTSNNVDRTVPLIGIQNRDSITEPVSCSSKSLTDSTPYFVSSPEMIEGEPKLSNWAQIEDYNEEAMTPINPLHVSSITYDVPSVPSPATTLSANKVSATQVLPRNNILASKGKRKASTNQSKKGKNSSGKAKTRPGSSSKSSNLIQEALNMLDDPELDLGESKSSAQEGSSSANNVTFLNLIENAGPSTMTSSVSSPKDNTISIPEPSHLGLDNDALAVVKSNTSHGNDIDDDDDDVARGLSSHVDMVQGDIDILKELLKNDSYSLDANTLLELFNEDPMTYVMPTMQEEESKKATEGNELMAYSPPNLVDLMEAYSFPLDSPTSADVAKSPPPSPGVLETPVPTPSRVPFVQSGNKRRKV